jgi:hypothetical protein
MNKHHPEVSVEVAKGETESVAELAQVKDKPLAEIDAAGIQATINVVNGAFKLKSQVKVDDVYTPGFVAKRRNNSATFQRGLFAASVAAPDLVSNSTFRHRCHRSRFLRQGRFDAQHRLIFPNYKAYEALRTVKSTSSPVQRMWRCWRFEWQGAKPSRRCRRACIG